MTIPMLARPLDMIYGPPDPAERLVPVVLGHQEPARAIWLAPAAHRRDVGCWVVNPGLPGQAELLPWKRRS